jgi:branched-chain amino acid transport system permease protein
VAGVLFASLVQFIEPGPFTVGVSIMFYLMVVVGGAGYFFGPVLGALIGVVVPEWIRDVPTLAPWYLPIFGVVVMLLMIWLPDGLLSLPEKFKRREVKK